MAGLAESNLQKTDSPKALQKDYLIIGEVIREEILLGREAKAEEDDFPNGIGHEHAADIKNGIGKSAEGRTKNAGDQERQDQRLANNFENEINSHQLVSGS